LLFFYSDHSISTRVERLDEAIMEASRALQGEPSGLWQYSETSCWVRVPRRKLHIQCIIIQHNNIMYTYYCDCYNYYYYCLLPLKSLLLYRDCHPVVSLQSRTDFYMYTRVRQIRHVVYKLELLQFESRHCSHYTLHNIILHAYTHIYTILCVLKCTLAKNVYSYIITSC